MNYKNICIHFLDKEKIKNRADLFRSKFGDDSLPVDIEKIIDLKLQIDIIPLPNLHEFCNADALITSNWQSIYVDNDKYLDIRYQNRLRFSLAHEIGHLILHKDVYSSFDIKSFEDFYQFIEKIPQEQYDYLETQANMFANNLLVPRDRLIAERQKVIKSVHMLKSVNLDEVDIQTLNSYLAIQISKVFGVSEKVIEISLNSINDKRSG